jgi:hypothetical protein
VRRRVEAGCEGQKTRLFGFVQGRLCRLGRDTRVRFQPWSLSFSFDLFSSMKDLISLAAPRRRFHCS